MKFKLIIVLLILQGNLFALNYKSRVIAEKIYCMFKNTNYTITGSKKKDIIYTIAIALNESSLGNYIENSEEQSYGIFQNNLHTLKNRYTGMEGVKECLTHSFVFNFINYLLEVEYWKKYLKKKKGFFNFLELLRYYNGGFSYNKRMTDIYIKKFYQNVIIVRKNWDEISKTDCTKFKNEIDFFNTFLKTGKLYFKYKKGICLLSTNNF